MKKVFFFLIVFFFPVFVSAGAIKDLEVKNGTLSRKFESNNNVYSIVLQSGEEKPVFEYHLENESSSIEVVNETEKITKIQVTSENNEKETYTFYVEKEETTPVFKETVNPVNHIETKIPHLEFYVGFGCFFIILILFKCIVLGFKKKK